MNAYELLDIFATELHKHTDVDDYISPQLDHEMEFTLLYPSASGRKLSYCMRSLTDAPHWYANATASLSVNSPFYVFNVFLVRTEQPERDSSISGLDFEHIESYPDGPGIMMIGDIKSEPGTLCMDSLTLSFSNPLFNSIVLGKVKYTAGRLRAKQGFLKLPKRYVDNRRRTYDPIEFHSHPHHDGLYVLEDKPDRNDILQFGNQEVLVDPLNPNFFVDPQDELAFLSGLDSRK